MSYGYGNQQNPYDQPDNEPGQAYGGAPQRGYGGQQGPYGQQRGGYGGQRGGYGGQQRGYGGQQNAYPPQQGGQSSQRGYRPQQQQQHQQHQHQQQQQQQQQNPYDGGANRYGYDTNSSMDGGYSGSTVEMAPLTQNAGSMANAQGKKPFLDRVQHIRTGIKQMRSNLQTLEALQKRVLNDASNTADSRNKRELSQLSESTMALYRTYVEEIRQLRSDPESHTPRNTPQLDGVHRDLKDTIREFQRVETSYRKANEEQVARQYRIINQDATPQQIQDVIRNGEQDQLFQTAIMRDRQGQAQSVLTAVKDRHAVLEQIERQMVELSQLFQDMDTLVVQQEAAIVQIEQKGEEVVENLDKGNEEMAVAVTTARKTRKKKWICLGIVIAIIIALAIVGLLVYFFVFRGGNSPGGNNNKNNNNNNNNKNSGKRSIEPFAEAVFDDLSRRLARY